MRSCPRWYETATLTRRPSSSLLSVSRVRGTTSVYSKQLWSSIARWPRTTPRRWLEYKRRPRPAAAEGQPASRRLVAARARVRPPDDRARVRARRTYGRTAREPGRARACEPVSDKRVVAHRPVLWPALNQIYLCFCFSKKKKATYAACITEGMQRLLAMLTDPNHRRETKSVRC
jgi:hypothetical protein